MLPVFSYAYDIMLPVSVVRRLLCTMRTHCAAPRKVLGSDCCKSATNPARTLPYHVFSCGGSHTCASNMLTQFCQPSHTTYWQAINAMKK